MHLSEIQGGKLFTIVFEDESEIEAEYRGRVTHINFSVFSPEIAHDINIYKGSKITIRFFDQGINYSFTSEIEGLNRGQSNTINCKATSMLKETPRRLDTRIKISLKVKVYTYEGSSVGFRAGQFICEALSDDISRGGICLFSDHYLDSPPGSMFVLELSLPRISSYMLPAKMMRSQNNFYVRAYNYEYGFAFCESQDQQHKLILDVMQARMSAERL